MDISAYLKEKEEIVNNVLHNLLPKEDEFPQRLHKAMRYSIFAGGKRIRPVLCLACAEVFGRPSANVVNIACAIEMIHTYSLIHDDLPAIDNDDLRRGMPTNHKVFGEAIAILAGDALLALSFESIARCNVKTGEENSRILRIMGEIAKASGSTGMVGGQVVDIESEGKEIAFPILEYIHIHKTGELLLASCRAGAIMMGADTESLGAITRYGEAVGLTFQIADDILDVEGNKAEMGKTTGGDSKKGKATYPSVLGIDESKKRAKELIDIAINAVNQFGKEAEPLREIARYIVERRR